MGAVEVEKRRLVKGSERVRAQLYSGWMVGTPVHNRIVEGLPVIQTSESVCTKSLE